MKTAISLPDETSERMTRSAAESGVSRSELFVRAAISCLDDLEARVAERPDVTVVVAVVTSNTGAATHPGNVFLPAAATGLPRDSVLSVTGVVTLNKPDVRERGGSVTGDLLRQVDTGLRQVLALGPL